jgi:uncharacterized protein (TIGR03067 family)
MNETRLAHPDVDQLSAFAQGRLAEAELAELSAHLDGCAECRARVEDAADDTLISLLRAADTEQEREVANSPHETVTHAPFSPTGDYPVSQNPGLPAELADHARYRVQELLGVGGMGSVYKAEHLLMERPVALKLISQSLTSNPAMVERFRREVKTAGQLKHPNIVMAYDAEQAGDSHFLVMEYVEGKSLARLVGEQGPLPLHQACDYIRQAALGLQYAHERGMVHRDIKPHNLMLTPEGQVKILDFGLARFAMEAAPAGALLTASPDATMAGSSSRKSGSVSLTQVGTVMGTPDYIAPEQATDAHTADIRADIYSLGCTLYDLLAGHVPFPEGTVIAKVMAHAERMPKPLTEIRKDVPPELARVIARMMAKDPAKRYQTPAEVVEALQPFIGKAEVKWRRTVRRWLIAASLAAAVVLTGTIIHVQTDKGELIIKTDDEDVAILVNQKGVTIRDEISGRKYLLKVGKHDVRTGLYEIISELPGGVEIEGGRSITIRRGGRTIVTAKLQAKGEPPLAGKVDHELIQGAWKLLHIEEKGVAIPDDLLKGSALSASITGNDISLNEDPKSPIDRLQLKGRFHLDPTKQPKTIDFFYLGDDAKPMLGIYDLKGDTLRLCWNEKPTQSSDRPTAFSTKGTNWTLAVWRREPKAGPGASAEPPTDKGKLINSFGPGFKPITRDGIKEDQGGWRIEAKEARVVRLHETEPPVEDCVVTYRAKLKSTNLLAGKAYLVMWARLPYGGEFFSKGLMSSVSGSSEWKSVETSFVVQKDERTDLFKLNLHIEGAGTVWIKDVELWQAPLPAHMKRPTNLNRAMTTEDGLMEFRWSTTLNEKMKVEGVSRDHNALRIDAREPRTWSGLQSCAPVKAVLPAEGTLFTYRAKMKANNLQNKAYLEIWCEFTDGPNKGEYTHKNLEIPLSGTTEWASYETSLPPHLFTQSPDQFKLNLAIEGKGTVWIKDIELLRGPAPK